MNFNFFICNTCENEEEDANLLIFGSKKQNILIKNNKKKINTKSLISSSDNNNSTSNYLEIIEYPYNFNNIDSNDYVPDPLPPLEKSNNKKKKGLNNDDDFLAGIKPPKLFSEGTKDNKVNKEILVNK